MANRSSEGRSGTRRSPRPRGWTRAEKRGRVAGVALCALLVMPAAAQTPDRTRTEAQAKRAGERLVALQREADRLAAQEATLLTDLRRLEVDRQLKTEQVKQAGADIAGIQTDIDATTNQMRALEAAEALERPELRSRLVEMYKLGRARYARLILSAPDVRRIGQASRTVSALAKLDRDRIEQHQRTIAELTQTRNTLAARQQDAVKARQAAERAQLAAARATQAQNDLIHDIDQRRDVNAQFAGELQAAQQKLQLALRDSAVPNDASLPLRPFRGDLDWPVAGTLRNRFGKTATPTARTSNGIEVGADDGSPVRAIHEGVVAFAGSFAGFGNLVILDHGSQSFSLYGDLLDITVAKGARLDRAQPVGSAGPLPSGGTGVYFELRIDGRPVDPLQWLKRKATKD